MKIKFLCHFINENKLYQLSHSYTHIVLYNNNKTGVLRIQPFQDEGCVKSILFQPK